MFVNFENEYFKLSITQNSEENLYILGEIVGMNIESATLFAANPINRMMTWSGSGLPFPNSEVAFDNTPNYYTITESSFNTNFKYPNSYQSSDWSEKIGPAIFMSIKLRNVPDTKVIKCDLKDVLPLKTLSWRPTFKNGPSFFDRSKCQIPDRQDQLLVNIANDEFRTDIIRA